MTIVRTRGFNHEGPRRGPVFVCSDFAKQIADIERGTKRARAARRQSRGQARLHRRARHGARATGSRSRSASRARCTTSARARLDASARCSTCCSRMTKVKIERASRIRRGCAPPTCRILLGDDSKFREGHGLEADDPVRADAARHAGVLAGAVTVADFRHRDRRLCRPPSPGPLRRRGRGRGARHRPSPARPGSRRGVACVPGWPATGRSTSRMSAAVGAWMRARNPDAVVHLAAQASARDARSHPAQTYERQRARSARSAGRGARRLDSKAVILVVGSADVYGSGRRAERIREDAPLARGVHTARARRRGRASRRSTRRRTA